MTEPTAVTTQPATLVTIREACRLLGGISRPTLYRLVADGELRIVKVRRRSFIAAADIDAFVAPLDAAGIAAMSVVFGGIPGARQVMPM